MSDDGGIGSKLTALISVGLLAVAGAIVAVIFLTEPEGVRETAVKKTAMLVDVTGVEAGTFRPTIAAMGTVRAARDVLLEPRVAGQVVARDPAFAPGRFVEEGQLLLRIDPADFRHALQQRRSELAQAESELALERGRQEVARSERAMVEGSLSEEREALILREPQLQAVQARVASARAAVDQSKLDLARTAIRAPFDAQVLTRQADVGSQIAPGDPVARLLGLDTFWVEVTVPVRALRWLDIPRGPGESGSEVRVRDRGAWPEDTWRTGHVESLIGQLGDQSRLARVLVAIPDPLARDPGTEGPAMIAGAFVEARLQGAEIADVVRLPRDLLRKDDTVWEMEEGALRIRSVDVAFQDAEYAYLRDGLSPDARVVTTDLSTVTEGAALRTTPRGENEAAEGDAAGEGGP